MARAYGTSPESMRVYSGALQSWLDQLQVSDKSGLKETVEKMRGLLASAHQDPKAYVEVIAHYQELLKSLNQKAPGSVNPAFIDSVATFHRTIRESAESKEYLSAYKALTQEYSKQMGISRPEQKNLAEEYARKVSALEHFEGMQTLDDAYQKLVQTYLEKPLKEVIKNTSKELESIRNVNLPPMVECPSVANPGTDPLVSAIVSAISGSAKHAISEGKKNKISPITLSGIGAGDLLNIVSSETLQKEIDSLVELILKEADPVAVELVVDQQTAKYLNNSLSRSSHPGKSRMKIIEAGGSRQP